VDDGTPWAGPGVHPGRVVATIQSLLTADSIIATDAGNFGLWLARGYRFSRPGTFLGPTSGAMGYGLPAAIAAGLCRPDRAVVALCGDGGFAMTMSELETAVREGVAVVALVFDNRRYGTIAMHQRFERRSTVAAELGPIDFAAVARACGAAGIRVERNRDFEPALREALASRRPYVLHLQLDARWISPDLFADA
jgi:acetolactate synthase-1/2/3 large subunit